MLGLVSKKYFEKSLSVQTCFLTALFVRHLYAVVLQRYGMSHVLRTLLVYAGVILLVVTACS